VLAQIINKSNFNVAEKYWDVLFRGLPFTTTVKPSELTQRYSSEAERTCFESTPGTRYASSVHVLLRTQKESSDMA
jgi:hypothetical protein